MNLHTKQRTYVWPVLAGVMIGLGCSGCEEDKSPPAGSADATTPTAAPQPTPSTLTPQSTADAKAKATPTANTESTPSGGDATTLEQIRGLCEAASLPPTPSLEGVPDDLLQILHDALSAVAKQKNEETMGRLALIYHALSHTREDTDRAVKVYEEVKTLSPQSYQWPHYLGRLFLGRRSFERARMEFEESIRLNPDYAMNLAWIGETELARGDADEALLHFEQYKERVEDKTYAHLGLAAAYLKGDRYDEFLEAIRTSRNQSGDCGRIHMLLADYYDRLERPNAADAERRIAQTLPSIRGAMRFDVLEVDMWKALEDSSSLLGKVQNLANSHDYDSAILLTQAVLEDRPDSALLKEALMVLYNQAGMDKEAIDAATRLLDETPDHAGALTIAAGILLRTEQFDKLLQIANQSLADNGGFAGGHACAGLAHAGLENYDEAEQSMLKAIEAAPNNAMYLESLSDIHAAQKEFDPAETYLKKMLDIKADDAVKTEVDIIAYQRLAGLMMAQEKIDDAFDYYENALVAAEFADRVMRPVMEQAFAKERVDRLTALLKKRLETDPESQQVRFSLAEVMGRSQKLPDAIATLQDGLAADPDSVRLRFALSRLLRSNGQIDESISELRRVIELQPDQPAPYAELAGVYLQQSNPKAAVRTAREGLAKNPNFPDLANTAAWILSSSPDQSLRDADMAVKLAMQACRATGNQHPNYLDTLATALAAAGRFDEAVRTEKRALAIARQKPEGIDISELEQRLELFESQKPFVDSN